MQFMSHLNNSYPPSCYLCVNSQTHKLAYEKRKITLIKRLFIKLAVHAFSFLNYHTELNKV